MPIESLSPEQLRREMDPESFRFPDTTHVKPSRELIGQSRAVEALDFGLRIRLDGYNIYMSGEAGEGKTRYALECAQKSARTMPVPEDWVHVHNFEDPDQPRALNMPAGMGRVFKKDMEEFIRVIEQEIVKAFDGEDYQTERTRIIRQFKDKKDQLISTLNMEAGERGFRVKANPSGIWFMPLVDGNPVDDEEFKELDEEIKSTLSRNMELLQKECADIVRRIREVESEAEEAVRDWEARIALYAVGMHMDDLRDKYSERANLLEYLDKVRADILANLDALRTEDFGEDSQAAFMQMMMKRNQEDDPRARYRINLLVDNSRLHGAPVIIDYNPTYTNLMGRCEYENEMGAMVTDFMRIKPGLFHQANGGFLILQMSDLGTNPQSFEAIKRTLKTRLITIEPPKDQMSMMGVATLKPEPVPLNVKVILVGAAELHHLLYSLDRDFRKLFKIKADFDDEMTWSEDNAYRIAQFISAWCEKEGMRHFDKAGVAAVVNHCSWLVQDQGRLTTHFNDIASVLAESATWAELDDAPLVGAAHVRKAVAMQRRRSSKSDEDLLEMYTDGTLMVDTDGWMSGQVNGLAVLDMGDVVFGKPSRITAATYMGKSGFVDIEREVDNGGDTHSKGVLILNGFIGNRFAQEIPLSLTASLCFEQLYNGVDGDSASSAELFAILSSLSDLPIFQGIAVTGSVNQHGMIQPIGGATFKVEGFFELCRHRGLNGKQGVILPHQNVKNLVLSDDVVAAVRDGLFHIWPIRTVDEGITLLTGVPAGEKQPDGSWPAESVNGLVNAKLRKFAETVARFQPFG